MKRFKKCQIFILCLSMLLVMFSAPMPAQAAFNKTTAKKNVTVTYKKLPKGVLAIYKNKNSTALKISATMHFRDGDKQDISKETQKNLCLAAKSTAAFFFQAPVDEYGQVINYSSYAGSFSVAQSKYKSYSSKITVSSDLQTIEGDFAAVYTGSKTLTNIHATIIFYDGDGHILGCSTKYLNCYKKNSIDQFSISYVGESWQPSKVKIYIDWAY